MDVRLVGLRVIRSPQFFLNVHAPITIESLYFGLIDKHDYETVIFFNVNIV